MNERSDTAVPVTFWIVGVVALVWNLLGVGSFFGEMSSGGLAEMAVWGVAAFAVAVFGGSLGSVLLLLKKALAEPVFIASLAGVAIQMFYNLAIAESAAVYGPFEITMTIMIPAIAAFLIWYARGSKQKGWIS